MPSSHKGSNGLEPVTIKKAVYSSALQTPGTIYTATIASLAGMYGAVFGFGPVALGVAGLGLAASLASGVFEVMIRGDRHANDYVKAFRKGLAQRRAKSLKDLTEKLTRLDHQEGLKQVELFRDKYDNFVGILDQKLAPGELTYNRYLTIAEQVFLAGLDNLEASALAIDSVSAIDSEHIEAEVARINALPAPSDIDSSRLQQLQARAALRTSQLEKSRSLLHENETALTQLDHVTTRIANINTQQGRAQIALEDAMAELKHLIDRADDYSN